VAPLVQTRRLLTSAFTEWKFYFLYIIWNALIPIFIYFVFVETHGRTLEELTQIFRGTLPQPLENLILTCHLAKYLVKTSLERKKVVMVEERSGEVAAIIVEDEEETPY
jgi:hypothetical protein